METPDFHEYMRNQLITYIKEEQKKGVPLEEIEKVLLDVGHHRNVIDECFDEIKKEDAGKDVEAPKEELKKDMITDVKGALQNFFGQIQQKDVKEVKKEATKKEEVEIIEEAVEEIKAEQRTAVAEGIVFFIYLVALAFLALYTAGSTGENITLVVIGLSASFINTFVSFAALGIATNVPIYVFIPVIISTIFYGLGTFGNLAIFQGMDLEALGIINVIISMFFNIIIINVAFLKPKPSEKDIAKVLSPEPDETPQDEKPPEEASVPAHSKTAHSNHAHIEALRQEFISSDEPENSPKQIVFIEDSIQHFLNAIHGMSKGLHQEHTALNKILNDYATKVYEEVQNLITKITEWKNLLDAVPSADLSGDKGNKAFLQIAKEMNKFNFQDKAVIRERLKRDKRRNELVTQSRKSIIAINSSTKVLFDTLEHLHESIDKLRIPEAAANDEVKRLLDDIVESQKKFIVLLKKIESQGELEDFYESGSMAKLMTEIAKLAEGTKMFIGIYEGLYKLVHNFPDGPPTPGQFKSRFSGLHTQLSKHVDMERKLRDELIDVISDIEKRESLYEQLTTELNSLHHRYDLLRKSLKNDS